ncbi:ergosterol biosynthesis protein [Rhodosporidiobolus nylandii]
MGEGSGLAVFNSVQTFLTTSLTRRVYSRSAGSVNPLQARTFGVWTLMSALVRIYAAYNISSKPMYDLALASYVLALGHFASEFLVFRTAGLVGVASPFIVAKYDFYVRA